MNPVRRDGNNRIPLFALLAANAVSMTGNVFTLIAIPWFVLQTTGSAAQTGLTSAFACAYVVATLSMYLMPALRQMDAPSPILNPENTCNVQTPRPSSAIVAEGRD